MRRSRKFCQKGSNFDNVFFFLVDEEREDSHTTFGAIISLPAKCYLNGVSLACR